MEKQKILSRSVPPPSTRGVPRDQRKGRKPNSTELAVQRLATIVAQQNEHISSLSKTPLGASLFRGRSDLGDLGDGIDQSIRSIKRLINAEVKVFDAAGANITPTTTGTITDLTSAIAQGVADNQRVGDSLKVLRLSINAQFSMNSTANGTQFCWVTLCRSHDEIMTAAQLNTLDANAYAYLGNPPPDYKDQYRMLWQRRLVVDPEHQSILVMADIKLNDHVQFNGGGATVNSGCLFMGIWSSSTTNNPDFGYVLRVEYVDN